MKNQVRIIGGQWKRRHIHFQPSPHLRPTSDRMRETLFNWIQSHLTQARCLDLFAGSGALGFEAASRGAHEVHLVEKNPIAAKAIRDNIQRLESSHIVLHQQSAERFLKQHSSLFDIVFIDPPFRKGLVLPTLSELISRQWLKPEAYLYVELESDIKPIWPNQLNPIRKTSGGESTGWLLEFKPTSTTLTDTLAPSNQD